jgi:hypothetical protein
MKRALFGVVCLGCAADADPAPPPPPCERVCQDGVALRAIRETMKLAYNLTLQGKPVGSQDQSTPCPLGGSARVFGSASSNPIQGATEVNLTYVLDACHYAFQDDDPEDNYEVTITAAIVQDGILAVQPSATSALVMKAENVKLTGKVYAPPIDYSADCPVEIGQSGSNVTGKICGRTAQADL